MTNKTAKLGQSCRCHHLKLSNKNLYNPLKFHSNKREWKTIEILCYPVLKFYHFFLQFPRIVLLNLKFKQCRMNELRITKNSNLSKYFPNFHRAPVIFTFSVFELDLYFPPMPFLVIFVLPPSILPPQIKGYFRKFFISFMLWWLLSSHFHHFL